MRLRMHGTRELRQADEGWVGNPRLRGMGGWPRPRRRPGSSPRAKGSTSSADSPLYSLSGMSLILSGGSVPAALATAVKNACQP